MHVRVTAAAPSPSLGVTPSNTQTPRPSPSPSSTPVSASQHMFCSSTVNSVTFNQYGMVADIYTNAGALTGSGSYSSNYGRQQSSGSIFYTPACTFTINNQLNQVLRIDFPAFRTEAFDYLAVYENISPPSYCTRYDFSRSPTRTCSEARLYWSGNSRPGSIVTSASTISFSFASDTSITYSGVHMRVGPNSLLPSAAPFALSGGGSTATVTITGGGVAGIIVAVLLVVVVAPFVLCILCCGGITAGCARLANRSSGQVLSGGSGNTTIIMTNPAAPAFQNPVHHHHHTPAPMPMQPGYPPQMQPQMYQPQMQPQMYPQQPAFPPTPVYVR